MRRHLGEETLKRGGYHIQALRDIHLYTRRDFGLHPRGSGDIDRLYLFGTIAQFVLLIACVNFTNLATARAQTRVREIGVKKVVGASRKQLAAQFISESTATALLASVGGLALAGFAIPYVSVYVGRPLELSALMTAPHLLALFLLVGAVGLAAGAYPAVYLSSRRPTQIVKGSEGLRTRARVRHGLIAFQFTVATVLIVGTLGVRHQLDYIQRRPLGFEKDLLITLPVFQMVRHTSQYEGNIFLARDYETVKQAFRTTPGVLATTASRKTMGPQGFGALRNVYAEGASERPLKMQIHSADSDFINVYRIPLIQGHTHVATDTREQQVVINQTAARMFGWDNPVGKRYAWVENQNRHVTCLVVGVMEDFHMTSLRESIPPLAFSLEPSVFNLITVRVNASQISETLGSLEATWNRFLPSRPFSHAFVDQNLDEINQDDHRFGLALSIVSYITILITCLGLLGLAGFVVRGRIKEIGIRKVLGASSVTLWQLLTGQLTKTVLLAGAIAIPIGYRLVDVWLDGFAYRTAQNPGSYVAATLGMFVMAIGVVSLFALQSARATPVDALRE